MNWKFWQKKEFFEPQRLSYEEIRKIWTDSGFQAARTYAGWNPDGWKTCSIDEVLSLTEGLKNHGKNDCSKVATEALCRLIDSGLTAGECLGYVAGRFGDNHYFGWFIDVNRKLCFLDFAGRFEISRKTIKSIAMARWN